MICALTDLIFYENTLLRKRPRHWWDREQILSFNDSTLFYIVRAVEAFVDTVAGT